MIDVEKNKKNIIFASVTGNMLEFYDFTLYGLLATFFCEKFFPPSARLTSFFVIMSTYGAGFLVRPLGAIFFGHLGDTLGRKKTLILSLTLMSVPTMIIGFLPTYNQIGIIASMSLLSCRLAQGFCVGGELSGATIFLLEHSSSESRWLNASLFSVSSTSGALLASGICILISQPFMPEWAWRIAFLLGFLAGCVGVFIRISLPETPSFVAYLLHSKSLKSANIPLAYVFKNHMREISYIIIGSALIGWLISFFVIYLNAYLVIVLHVSLKTAHYYSFFLFFSFIILCPVVGCITQIWRYKEVMLFGAISMALCIYPLMLCLQHQSLIIKGLSLFIIALLSACYIAPFNNFMTLIFPIRVRYTGSALAYNLGVCIFGGSMPLISLTLANFTGNPLSFCYFLSFLSILSAYVVYFGSKYIVNPPDTILCG